MPAETSEYTVFDAFCVECHNLPLGEFESRQDARRAADEHDAEHHPPVPATANEKGEGA